MRVWVDLTNSPHVLVLRPIVALLRARGHEVQITARDFAQTLGLLERFEIDHTVVGHHRGERLAAKGLGLAQRSGALCQPEPLCGQPFAAVVADDRVVDLEALQEPERLGEVARRDLHLVAPRTQQRHDRAQNEHVRAVRKVDPDAHRANLGRSSAARFPTSARYPSPRVFVLASLTDPIVEFATSVVADLGLPGVFVLMALESACIPIPSEATMLFAGFNVSEGEYSLIAVTLVGSFANLVGSWIAYAVGYYGRVDILEKHGKKLHIKPSHLHAADRWFEKHGDATVFFTRMLPIIRTFISLPAGVARMPFWRFTVLTFLGCLPWVFALTYIGQQVGENWEQWKDSLHYVDYAVAALIVLGIAYLIVRRRRGGGGDAAVGPAEPAADAPRG